MKNELTGKMERYNMIRHDDDMDDEKKEAIREELFEGNHSWPFLRSSWEEEPDEEISIKKRLKV
jgi:hypothetical protein